jgi:hypothetical protein
LDRGLKDEKEPGNNSFFILVNSNINEIRNLFKQISVPNMGSKGEFWPLSPIFLRKKPYFHPAEGQVWQKSKSKRGPAISVRATRDE